MTNLLTEYTKNFNTVITFVFLFIIVYIIIYPNYLSYYFNSALGRTAMLFFIVAVTSINYILGILATVVFIGLNSALNNSNMYSYSSPCLTEGMVIMGGDSNQPQKLTAVTSFEPSDMGSNDMILKGGQDVDVSILPPPVSGDSSPVVENFYAPSSFPTQMVTNNNLNRKITIENYIRKPRSSNQMPFSKYSESKTEPKPNYLGIGSIQGISPSAI
jgi:hypothetical protein